MVSNALEPPRGIPLDEDAIVVSRFLAGDEGAFDVIYRRYHDKIFSIAKGVLLSAEDAADAVQEIFTLVYRNLHRFDRRSRFSTWIFRVAVNRSIQEARKTRRHRHTELLEAVSIAEDIPDTGDPRVSIALAEMTPADRAVLVLFYWEDMNLVEIGEALDCAPNAAKTRLYRARERFRKCFEGLEA